MYQAPGFDIEDANTAKKALELLDTTEYDLVLCDFRLDNMDGKTMLIKIKEKYPQYKFMPFEVRSDHDLTKSPEVFGLSAALDASHGHFPKVSRTPLAVSQAASSVTAIFSATER